MRGIEGRGRLRRGWWIGAAAAVSSLAVAAAATPRETARDAAEGAAAEVVVRYPARLQLIASDSNFLFGSVSEAAATLEINGVPVEVHEDGGFLAWLEAPEASEDQRAVYRLIARTATDTVVLDHPIRRPRSARPSGAPSPWVDPGGLGLRAERWVRVDEPISFEFVAESGTRMNLQAGARVFEVPRVAVQRGDLDLYHLEIAASDVREAACDAGGCSRGSRSGVRGGRAGETPAPGVAVDTLDLSLLLDSGTTQRTEKLRLPLALLAAASRPSVRLGEAPDPINGRSEVVVGRPTPFGPYRWRFSEGTTVPVTGRFGDRLRVRVRDGLDAWVLADDATWEAHDSAPAVTGDARLSRAGGVDDGRPHLASEEGAVALRVGLSRPVAAEAEVIGPRSIALTIHDAFGQIDRFAHGVGTGVRIARWTQEAGPSVRIELEFEWQIWGYRLSYESGDAAAYEGARTSRPLARGERATLLRLDVRQPPEIDADAPLRGRRIAIDPGHPGAGSHGPTGFFEGDANLAVARRLADLLEEAGARPLLIRDSRSALGLYERTRIAREGGAEILVSIHNNALPDGIRPFERAGTATYYHHAHSAGLGSYVQRALAEQLGLRDLGVVWGDLAVVREPWMPAILTEGAFMLIPEQEAALRTPRFQTAYARGVLNGIRAFLRASALGAE